MAEIPNQFLQNQLNFGEEVLRELEQYPRIGDLYSRNQDFTLVFEQAKFNADGSMEGELCVQVAMRQRDVTQKALELALICHD